VSQTVQVRLFARFRELAGAETVSVPVAEGTSVEAIREHLGRLWPGSAGLVQRSAVAVNEEYAGPDRVIRPDDDVALIPPVSGG
jgi:molybdopterin converting factor subunit 1